MDAELICNFRKCRKPIKNEAWVTSCSHVFCSDDGDREFHNSLTCPACNTQLAGKYDIVKMDTNPNEQYKAIILAGLSPDNIMEIASRAMSFWGYQIQQELIYRQNLASRFSEQRFQIEDLHKQTVVTYQTELNNVNKELDSTKQEVINQKQRSAELSEKLMEKNRQLQKVQAMYENLRRKCISPISNHHNWMRSVGDQSSMRPPRPPSAQSFEFPQSRNQELYKERSCKIGSYSDLPAGAQSVQSFAFFPNEASHSGDRRVDQHYIGTPMQRTSITSAAIFPLPIGDGQGQFIGGGDVDPRN